MKHVPLSYWKTFNDSVEKAKGGALRLGELLDGDAAAVARTWSEGGFNAMFDFPLGYALGDVFCRGRSVAKLAAVLSNDRRYPDPSMLVTLVDNHDLPRVMSVCGGDESKVRGALAFLLTGRGIPSLAWGTEIGAEGQQEPENRASMRFVAHPLKDEISFWLTLRKVSPALSDGAPVVLALEDGHLAIGRVHSSQLAVVLVNRRSQPWTPALKGPWATVPFKDARGGSAVSVPPKSVTVWRTEPSSGSFTELAGLATAQWKTGAAKRTVELRAADDAEEGLVVVGSGPELGDWKPEKGKGLPAKVELPVGAVFEYKLVRMSQDAPAWETGENHVLFVEPGDGTLRIRMAVRAGGTK